jgi:hypothetical protein
MLLRFGDTIINMDNVMRVNLDWEDEGTHFVVFEFTMRGSDRLEDGEGVAQPYIEMLEGEEAEAIRNYLKRTCPNIVER